MRGHCLIMNVNPNIDERSFFEQVNNHGYSEYPSYTVQIDSISKIKAQSERFIYKHSFLRYKYTNINKVRVLQFGSTRRHYSIASPVSEHPSFIF